LIITALGKGLIRFQHFPRIESGSPIFNLSD
jgi:hypothetical protein